MGIRLRLSDTSELREQTRLANGPMPLARPAPVFGVSGAPRGDGRHAPISGWPGQAARRAVLSLATLVLVGSFGAGCGKKRETPQAAPSALPPDRLAAGEVAEGHAKAFALRLPQRSTIVSRGMTPVVIQSGLTPEELSNYVRARIATTDAGDVVAGSARTEFRNVVVPAEPNRWLTIQIGPGRSMTSARSEMIVTDTTPAPLDPKDSEEDRWRKAGYTPQGKPLDPSHMQ